MEKTHTKNSIIALFFHWYYLEAPAGILRGYAAYARSFAEIFPFLFLLRTLFSPWKNIVDRSPMHGIDLKKITEKLSLGLLACMVGFFVRILTILLGLIAEMLLLAATILYLTVWLTFPILLVLGTAYCIQSL
ncbi:hypothetical protein EXS65_04940 [Candidatus Peribacteria bacterium]|nr:hypothetical protein [Candidatus Peribacteria bacterium]